MNKEQIFIHTKTIYLGRYYVWLLWVIGGYVIHPILNEGIAELPNFIYGAFFKDWAVSLVFLSVPFFWIIVSITATANNVKTITIQEDLFLIKFFGIFKEKPLELNYSDISSLEWSKNNLYHFVFTLKNGKVKLIRAEIIDRERAFSLIQEKIKEANSKNT